MANIQKLDRTDYANKKSMNQQLIKPAKLETTQFNTTIQLEHESTSKLK